ncbi:MAG: CinA-like protein [Acidobacteriota bacterium]|nr:CinA-like protein [Acidobacteriota bacterium]
MRAIFIAVGSELLDKEKIDTNSIYMAQKLQEKGILTDMKVVVGDDITNLSWIVKNASKRAQLLIITGGLGPTEDDITREAVAEGLKRDLEFKEEIAAEISERFKKRGITMPEINTRQAFIVQGAEVLPNPLGTAPGQYIDDENCKILLLPGPPHEMRALFDTVLEEKIAPLSNYFIYKRMFKFGAITESETDAMLAELYTRYKNIRTTILASPGLIEVHLLGRSRKTVEEAQIAVDELAEKIKERMKDYLVTEKDISLEQLIVEELKKRKLTLSVAESCTGGGLGNRITNVPGSSEVFLGGVIAYSNNLKIKLLGVKENTLKRHGAVSKDTAREMAQGIRALTGSDIGLSITGIAGPGGASVGKPVGLVFIHSSTEKDDTGFYQIFPGERDVVKTRTINYSLSLLRKHLETWS